MSAAPFAVGLLLGALGLALAVWLLVRAEHDGAEPW